MKLPLLFALCGALAVTAQAGDPSPIPIEKAPAPLFDDPVWHGAADPTVIWNPARNQWLMYYTQRRATLQPVHGVDWCHGTAIGIAFSPDGITWKYEGTCQGDHDLSDPQKAGVTWWAPSVYAEGGVYHMFVVCVEGGLHTDWSGRATIPHFTSMDGLHWTYVSTPKLSSDRCIDACVAKIGGEYLMWYKDERHGSHIWSSRSADLKDWTVVGEAVGDVGQEAPLVWQWRGAYWMLADHGGDLRAYRSPDGLKDWTFQTSLFAEHGTREKDTNNGKHPFVQVQGDRAFIYYFVHYQPAESTYADRRTVIQMAELQQTPEGKIVAKRDPAALAPGGPGR